MNGCLSLWWTFNQSRVVVTKRQMSCAGLFCSAYCLVHGLQSCMLGHACGFVAHILPASTSTSFYWITLLNLNSWGCSLRCFLSLKGWGGSAGVNNKAFLQSRQVWARSGLKMLWFGLCGSNLSVPQLGQSWLCFSWPKSVSYTTGLVVVWFFNLLMPQVAQL